MTISGAQSLTRTARVSYISSAQHGILALSIVNDNACRQRLPLFEYFNVSAIEDYRHWAFMAAREIRNRAASAVSSWSAVDEQLSFGEYSYQLHLPMSSHEFNNIVRLVPHKRYPALDNHFPSVVRGDQALSKLAIVLAHRRKLRLGDVVQMPEGELLTLLKGNRNALERLRSHLQAHTLDFGMRAPRWNSPGGLLAPEW